MLCVVWRAVEGGMRRAKRGEENDGDAGGRENEILNNFGGDGKIFPFRRSGV